MRHLWRAGRTLFPILVGAVLALAVASPAGAVVASTPAIAVQQGATCAYDGPAYVYDATALLSTPNAATARPRASPAGPRAVSGELSVSIGGCCTAANTGRKTIAIGEGMEDRVIPFAKKNGADWYKPDPNAPPSKWMENNRQWINHRMDEGCRFLDCGPAPGRPNYPGPTSPYYQMELDEIFKRGYGDYVRVGID